MEIYSLIRANIKSNYKGTGKFLFDVLLLKKKMFSGAVLPIRIIFSRIWTLVVGTYRNHLIFSFWCNQRIYIYIEFKATPLRLCSRGLLPQKAGTRITVHLSAAWSTIFVGLESIMQVYTVGWVNFCTFFSNLVGNFMHLHVVYSLP